MCVCVCVWPVNNYGAILNEIGVRPFFTELVRHYIEPIARVRMMLFVVSFLFELCVFTWW